MKSTENFILTLIIFGMTAYFTYVMTKSGMIDSVIRFIKNPSKY